VYSDQYKLDYLLMAAQGYQESQLNQRRQEPGRRHRRDQVMAGDWQGADTWATSRRPEANIHAGVKYMRFMQDQYFKDEPQMDGLTSCCSRCVVQRRAGEDIRQLR